MFILNKLKMWFWNILIALDQLANTLLLGDPDETMSSRMGKSISENKCIMCKFICKVLNFFESDHCVKSIEPNVGSNNVAN